MKRSRLYYSGKYSNLSIVFNDKKYCLHKEILCESFKLFEIKENNKHNFKNDDLITISDYNNGYIDNDLIEKSILYAYDHDIYDPIAYHDIISMYIISDFLSCEKLKNYYFIKLKKYLDDLFIKKGLTKKTLLLVSKLRKMIFKYDGHYKCSYNDGDLRDIDLKSNRDILVNVFKNKLDSVYVFIKSYDSVKLKNIMNDINVWCQSKTDFLVFINLWNTYKDNLINYLEKNPASNIINHHFDVNDIINEFTIDEFIQLQKLFPENIENLIYLTKINNSINVIKKKIGKELFNKTRKMIYIKKSLSCESDSSSGSDSDNDSYDE